MAASPISWTAPADLAWQDVDAHCPGSIAADGAILVVAFDVSSSVSLELRTPCALTWDDVVVLNGGPSDFVRIGDEMVRHPQGQVLTRIRPPSPATARSSPT